jgi:hypothetical protein
VSSNTIPELRRETVIPGKATALTITMGHKKSPSKNLEPLTGELYGIHTNDV